MKALNLCGPWDLIERPLADGPAAALSVLCAPADLSVCVPGDVSDALVQAGREPEPLVAENFRRFAWVQDRSWWFRRTVSLPADWAWASAIELSLDGLDVHADVWCNGVHIGSHLSAFHPFRRDIREHVRFGEDNTILVRLTTGREHAEPHASRLWCRAVPTEGSRGYPDRGLPERIYLRKPAFTWGWDWAPMLATCGITGTASLRAHARTEITDVSAVTVLAPVARASRPCSVEASQANRLEKGDRHLRDEQRVATEPVPIFDEASQADAAFTTADARVRVTVEIEHATLFESARGDVSVRLTDADGREFLATARNVFLASGTNFVDVDVEIPNARLWWPNGSGEPHLYTLRASVTTDAGDTAESDPIRYGVRTVELDTAPGRFAVVVNGVPLFIQGGNWVPSDSLYGRISDEKLHTLVAEAAEANFNCLRLWGGGRFEADAFYDACDERGILVWHDFMSACAPLPADEDWFRREFLREADYQIRRLRSRPCLLLWCGNNEVSMCGPWAAQAIENRRDPAWELYFRDLPRLVRQLAPHVPYWPTSPYGGVKTVSDNREGDDHHWVVMRKESEFWSNPWYWDGKDIPIFNSEYGYGGPCCLTSTKQYLGLDESDLASEDAASSVARASCPCVAGASRPCPEGEPASGPAGGPPIDEGRPRHPHGQDARGTHGRDAHATESMDVLRSEVGRQHTNSFYDIPRVNHSIRMQYADPEGLSLERYILLGGLCQGLNLGYSLESLRANAHTMGGIFWMYNDAWGENGWTIIDYYLRRKVSYYGVRRRLAPRRLVLRPGGMAFGGEPGEVVLRALNGRPQPLDLSVRVGYQSFDGSESDLRTVRATIPGRSNSLVARIPAPDPERCARGTVVAIPERDELEWTWWQRSPIRELNLPPVEVSVVEAAVRGEDLDVTVTAPRFAHAVHLNTPDDLRASDLYFDLYPKQRKTVTVHGGAQLRAEDVRALCVTGGS